ncbi:cell adhesion molecule DSCAM-like [Mya arenaria]|uniref:cell adhesion molecule DSCAM-like n=1 Tax=Mya arenaria TaxID=6604 RepID=UPI0022E04DE8|nr:cell adhesion molecule DSCAM-like [Mya arenaria]
MELHLLLMSACCLLQASATIIILEHPSDQAIVYGQDLFLNCSARNLTSGIKEGLIIHWQLNNLPISRPTSVYSNGTLLVPGVTANDLGNYTCMVHDSANVFLLASHPANVFHAYIKMFEVSPVPVYAIEDEIVSFDCITGESAPPPHIYWERNGELYTGGEQYSATYGGYSPNSLVIQYSMRLILKAKPYLDGAYNCVARNPVLKIDVRSLKVRMQTAEMESPPYVIMEQLIPNVITPLGQPLILDCPVTGKPAVTVTWYKDEIQLGGDFFTLKNNSLHRPMLISGDEGNYTCQGVNGLGLARSPNISVMLARIDMTFREVPQDLYGIAGLPAILKCTPPYSIPSARVTWYKDNALLVPRSGEQSVQVMTSSNGSWNVIFEEIQKRDEGEYFCVATNNFAVPPSRTSQAATIRVGGAPIFIEPPIGKTVEKGKLAHLSCYVQGDPFPEVTWLFEDVEVTVSNTVSFRQGNQELWIGNINKGNEGTYTCRAVNRYGAIQTKVYIKVLVPPVVLQPVGDTVVSKGDTVIIPCGIYSDPAPLITWFKDSAAVIMGGRFTQIPDGLYITSVQVEDSGTYLCQASNMAGTVENQGTLTVLVRPYFLQKPVSQVVNRGNNVTLNCVASGYPQPQVTWLFNGSSLFPKDTMLSLDQSQLLLLGVNWLHVGDYTCRATNREGSSQETAAIRIRVPPKVTSIEGIPLLYQGEHLQLTCRVTGIPDPLIEWFHNREQLFTSSNGRISFPEPNKLSVMFANENDAGIYTCKGSNNAGVSQKDMEVFIISRPSPPVLLSASTLSASSVELAWSTQQREPQTPVDKVIIFYRKKLEMSSTYTEVELISTMLKYTISSLDPATEYIFMISAINGAGTSGVSNVLAAKTFDAGPSVPRNFHMVEVESVSFTVGWEIPLKTNGKIKKYQVTYREQNMLAESTVIIQSDSDPSHDYKIEGLAPYTWYNVKVRGATIEGDQVLWGNWSNTMEVKTAQAAPSGMAREVKATPLTSDSIQLSWEAVLQEEQNGPIKRYYVTYWLLSNLSQPVGEEIIDNLDLQVNITDLDSWTWYMFKITSENAGGRGQPSDPVNARTFPTVPTGAPRSVTVEPHSSRSLLIKWEAPPVDQWNSDLSGFIVQYWNDITMGSLTSLGVLDLTTIVKNLVPYTQYTVRVASFTNQLANGIGPYSENITVKTLQDVPGMVENLQVRATTTSLRLSWRPPPVTNGIISHYLVTYVMIGRATPLDMDQIEVNFTENIGDLVQKEALISEIFINFSPKITRDLLYPIAHMCDTVYLNSTALEKYENTTDISQSEYLLQFNISNVLSDWMKDEDVMIGDLCGGLKSAIQEILIDNAGPLDSSIYNLTTTASTITLSDLEPDFVYNITINAATGAGYGRAVLLETATLAPVPTLPTTARPKPRPTPRPTTTPWPLGQEAQISDPLNLPVIIGGGVAGLFLLVVIFLLICCLFMRRQKKRQSDEKASVIQQESIEDNQFNSMYGQLDRPRAPAIAAAAEDGTDSVDLYADQVRFQSPTRSPRNGTARSFMTESSGNVPVGNGRRIREAFKGMSFDEIEAQRSDDNPHYSGLAAPGTVKANPAYYEESASSDQESISVSMVFSAEDSQLRESTLKRKNKMRSMDAAAIARLRSSTLPSTVGRHNDMSALISDDVQIVFNERTAL